MTTRSHALLAAALLVATACSSEEDAGGPSNAAGAGATAGSAGGSGESGAAGTGGMGGSGGVATGGTSGSDGHAGTGGSAGAAGGAGAGAEGGSAGAASGFPAPNPCDEGTTFTPCADGVAEADCPDQLTFFQATMQDTATGYWQLPKPKGGFRMADKYAHGSAYMRFEATSKPTDIEVFPQVCFWRWEVDAACQDRWKVFAETCSSQNELGYTSTGVYYVALGAPADWWQKASPAWEYSLPWDAMRILQKAVHEGSKYLLQDASCGSACWPVAGGAAEHMPIDITAELVLVAEGKTFTPPSSWSDCSEPWCQ
jgi:hypothetical protein